MDLSDRWCGGTMSGDERARVMRPGTCGVSRTGVVVRPAGPPAEAAGDAWSVSTST